MKRGFTLIEITVVLAIIGLVIGGGMATLTAGVQQNAYNATVTTMNAIDQALYNYANAFGRLPCPSDITLSPASTNYGLEAGSTTGGVGTGECITGKLPQANRGAGSTSEEGGVPTRALRLSDSYMYDGWGHKIRYAVAPDYTYSVSPSYTSGASNVPTPIPGNICNSSSRTGLTVYDVSGNTRSKAAAAYVLVSHGSNGHGAYTMNGGSTMFNAGNSNPKKLMNCSCNSTAGSTGVYNGTYTQATPYYSTSGNAAYYFDDVVSFKEPWQLVNVYSTAASSTASCGGEIVLINDQTNDNIQLFNASGSYVSTIAPSIGSYNSMAIDASGNIWESGGGNILNKYNLSGALLQTIDTTQPPATMNGIVGIIVDASGNIWAMDNGSCVVDVYNSAGVYLAQFGSCGTCGSNPVATNCPNSGASYYYKFNNTNGGIGDMTLDSSGNLWIADQGNCRFLGYTVAYQTVTFTGVISGGSKTLTVSNISGGVLQTGQTIFGAGIAYDTVIKTIAAGGGNGTYTLYQAASSSALNETMTATGPVVTYLTQGGTCGTGSQQFNQNSAKSAWGIAPDASATGYVYVTDFGNNRIEKWSKTGVFQNNLSTTPGSSPGQLGGPDVITMDKNGYLWVTNDSNKRADKFSITGAYQNISIGPTVSGGTNFSAINFIRTYGGR